MRIRLFSACVVSAWLAAQASAQTTPTTLPPLIVPVPPSATPIELPAPPPKRPAILIDVKERPSSTPAAQPAATGRAIVITVQEQPGSAAAPPIAPTMPTAPTLPAVPVGPVPPLGPSSGFPVVPRPMLPAPVNFNAVPPGLAGRVWFDNAALFWWTQGTRLPPLVSTSPAGTPAAVAGILGATGSSIYGPGSQDNGLRFGYRFITGAWLDDDRRFAIEAEGFMTANGGNQFNAFSPGDPILARPVINAVTGAPAAEPIAVPGVANGSIHVSTSSTGILGAGIWLRENFTRTDDPCDTCHLCSRGGCCGGNGCAGCDGSRWYCRFDSLFGYRYLRMSDNLEIDDQVNAVAALNGVPAGSTLTRSDQFHASNTFNGIDMGMTGDMSRGPWSIGAVAKVAVGFNDSSIDINGLHSVGGVTSLGGLLAQTTNIGHYSRTQTSAVPELGLKLAYSFAPNIKVYAGYSFLYWFHVARAANQVNPMVDPAFLTSAVPLGNLPTQPSALLEDRGMWMQALTVGFEWRY